MPRSPGAKRLPEQLAVCVLSQRSDATMPPRFDLVFLRFDLVFLRLSLPFPPFAS